MSAIVLPTPRYVNRLDARLVLIQDQIIALVNERDASGKVGSAIQLGMSITKVDIDGNDYGNYQHPLWRKIGKVLCLIERAEKNHTVITDSGRSAINVTFGLLNAHSLIVIVPDDLYPGTRGLFKEMARTCGHHFVYAKNSSRAALEAALEQGKHESGIQKLSMVFGETITNPNLMVCDIPTIAKFAHDYGALYVVDNTPTPISMQPLDHGADIVVHSITKVINGHGDASAGGILVRDDRPDLYQSIMTIRKNRGGVLDPMAAYRVLNGAQHLKNHIQHNCGLALAMAQWCATLPHFAQVNYPGLERHPDYERIQTMYQGSAGSLAGLYLKGGLKAVTAFLEPHETNGIDDDAIIHGTTFAQQISAFYSFYLKAEVVRNMTESEREKLGLTENFVRFAAGQQSFEYNATEFARRLNKIPENCYTL